MNKKIIALLLFVPFVLSVQGNSHNEKQAKKTNVNNKKSEIVNAILASAENCEWGGIELYGKVQFVSSSADISIKYVEYFPDIKVKFVNAFPSDCGEWQVVESFPDFTVQIVENFADLEVQVVENFPGM